MIEPQLVGSELRRVLRTIIAPSPTGYHTFPNIYYLPVRKQLLTFVHIELALVTTFAKLFLDDAVMISPLPTRRNGLLGADLTCET